MKLIIIAALMSSISLFAKTDLPKVDQSIKDLFKKYRATNEKEMEETNLQDPFKLQKSHKNYLPLEIALVYAYGDIGLREETQYLYESRFNKKKSKENELLYLISQISSWRTPPAELTKVLEKVEALTDKKTPSSDLNYNIQITLIKRSRNNEQKERAAKILLEHFPNDPAFHRYYPRVLAAKGNLDELLKRCNAEIDQKNIELSSCTSLSSAQVEKTKEQVAEIDKINQKVESLLATVEDLDFLKALHAHSSALDNDVLSDKIAMKISKKEENWLPSENLREYFKIQNYEQYKLFDELYKIMSTPDVQTKIDKLKEQFDKLAPYKELTNYLYRSLVSSYMHPTIKDNEEAIGTLEEWLEYDKDNDFAKAKLAELYLEEDKKLDQALQLTIDSLTFADENVSKDQKYFSKYTEFFDYYKKEYSSLYLLKGKIYQAMDKYDLSLEDFKKSFMITPTPKSAYHLYKSYLELENNKEAYTWALISLVDIGKKEGNLSEEEVKKANAFVKEHLKSIFKENLETSKITKLIEQKKVLYHLDEKKEEEQKHPLIGKDVIPLPYKDLKKKDFNWASLKGKNVLLSFWATWCVPCIQELTVLDKLKKEYKGKPFEIVAICTDGISKKKDMHKILKKAKIKNLQVLVGKSDSMDKYGFNAIPTSFYVNPKGKIIDMGQGYSDKLEEEIKKKLNL